MITNPFYLDYPILRICGLGDSQLKCWVYYAERKRIVEEIIRAINDSLDNAKTKLTWYAITGDNQYMDECKEWQNIASIYMNQLIMEQKNETCESTD
jgi:hypothetical protein